jgi:hypothetical protein
VTIFFRWISYSGYTQQRCGDHLFRYGVHAVDHNNPFG